MCIIDGYCTTSLRHTSIELTIGSINGVLALKLIWTSYILNMLEIRFVHKGPMSCILAVVATHHEAKQRFLRWRAAICRPGRRYATTEFPIL